MQSSRRYKKTGKMLSEMLSEMRNTLLDVEVTPGNVHDSIVFDGVYDHEGYREYKSKPYICETCPTRQLCTHSRSCQKTVTRHVWQDYLEQAEDVRHSPVGRAAYDLRSQTIERVFADAKEKHGMRYTHHRGLTRVTNWVRLKFAAMNLKKLAVWRWKERFSSLVFLFLYDLYCGECGQVLSLKAEPEGKKKIKKQL